MSNDTLASGLPATPEAIMAHFEITDADLKLIADFGAGIEARMPNFVDTFYVWLEQQTYYRDFFPTERTRERAHSRQIDYWKDFFKGVVDHEYIERRRYVGRVHAQIELPLDSYMAGITRFLSVFMQFHAETGSGSADGLVHAVCKMINMDQMITADMYSQISAEKLVDQSAALIEMSTPVTAIWDGVLLLPLVGIIDSQRAMDITGKVLEEIQRTQATSFILDISGVAVIDTAVANYLIKITKGTQLMGCETIISGISPAIAQTIVGLGIDVGDVRTTGNLRDALRLAFAKAGFEVAQLLERDRP